MSTVKQLVAFHGNRANVACGNHCELVVHSQQPDTLPETQAHTLCLSWPHTTISNHIIVSCYNGQRLIACCGHGLLCSAWYWLHKNEQQSLVLVMNDHEIPALIEDDKIWLQFNTSQCVACSMPAWLNHFFSGSLPITAATCGGEQEYLILRWPDDTDLSNLATPSASLVNYTKRALICTSKINHGTVDVHYRYFAPQYGVSEDTATGSAMRVLASYYRQPVLSALQVSPQRGLLFAQYQGDNVRVGGYCTMEG